MGWCCAQLDRVDKKEQEELRDTVKDPTNVIAKVDRQTAPPSAE